MALIDDVQESFQVLKTAFGITTDVALPPLEPIEQGLLIANQRGAPLDDAEELELGKRLTDYLRATILPGMQPSQELYSGTDIAFTLDPSASHLVLM